MDCQEKSVSYEYGRAAFVYDRQLQDSIVRFKYYGRQEYAEYYAQVLFEMYQEWIREKEADLLLPVPVHKNRMRRRGYNQAALVAHELSELCNIPVCDDFLIRQRDTLPQKELSSKERLANLMQAFATDPKGLVLNQVPECAILIDDIYTTGSTIEACSQVLRRVGVQRIYFLCVCIGKGY